MELGGKVVVVTGAGSGIGQALARRFAAEQAEAVVVADLDGRAAEAVAAEVGGLAVRTDVAVDADVAGLVRTVEERWGRVDLFCANAGVAVAGGVDGPDEGWGRSWNVNVMSQVYAARALLPGWLARGSGYLLVTVSAAGLLTNLGAAPYTVTKHAALALAEWLAITHGDAGLKVSCLCPQGVRTPMLLGGMGGGSAAAAVWLAGGVLEPEDVAEATVAGLREERFLILPQPEVAEYARRKAEDPDRWLRGMRRLQARLDAETPDAR
jgi:NAD(P)-dependent dehydrogenase (short-subunit alcohol dehydrogenase family)